MSEAGGKNVVLKTLAYAAGFFGISYLFYKLYFLRTPSRKIPNNNQVFVSPANGRVLSVRKFNSESFIETKDSPITERGAIKILTSDVASSGTVITIKLQITDVHYQRAPIAGKVISLDYVQGSFKNAVFVPQEQGSRYENEHNSILLETESGLRYKVVQIAGFVARVIESMVTPLQIVNQGDIIGLIKLGSQVTVILPASVVVMVKEGDLLIDGETIIGKLIL